MEIDWGIEDMGFQYTKVLIINRNRRKFKNVLIAQPAQILAETCRSVLVFRFETSVTILQKYL